MCQHFVKIIGQDLKIESFFILKINLRKLTFVKLRRILSNKVIDIIQGAAGNDF